MLIDAQISMHSSFLPDIPLELVKQYFLDHDYGNLTEGCISIIPRCALQGAPIHAFVAGRGDPIEQRDAFIVLLTRDTDPLTQVQIEAAKVVLVYTTIQELPQLLHRFCTQLYQMIRSSRPLRQKVQYPVQLLAFRAIPGIGRKRAELLHRQYSTLRRFIDALHSENTAQLSSLLPAAQISRLRTLFAVDEPPSSVTTKNGPHVY